MQSIKDVYNYEQAYNEECKRTALYERTMKILSDTVGKEVIDAAEKFAEELTKVKYPEDVI